MSPCIWVRGDSSLGDLAGLNTTGAHQGPLGDALKIDLDLLQVGEESSQGFTGDLGTRATVEFTRAPPFIFVAGNGALPADHTDSHFIFLS